MALTTSGHAGAHASCAALRLIAHPLFPLPDAERQNLAEKVVLHHLIPLFQGNKTQSAEAKSSTVKVASFVSACAALGKLPLLDSTFQQMLPVARNLVLELLNKRHDLCWGHWLGQDQGSAYRPTAAAIDALSRLAKVDASTEPAVKDFLAGSVEEVTREFLIQTRALIKQPTNPNSQQLIVPDLWHRIPLLLTIATMPSPPNRQILDDYQEILNAYLSRSVFAWWLTDTEDFQTHDNQTGRAKATDYVSFNTTAYLVRAVIGLVATAKVEGAYLDWVMPHLAYSARIIRDNQLPEPKRFSAFHQALNGSLEALEFHEAEKLNNKKILPDLLPMYINPPLFQPHEIPLKPRQGFYTWRLK